MDVKSVFLYETLKLFFFWKKNQFVVWFFFYTLALSVSNCLLFNNDKYCVGNIFVFPNEMFLKYFLQVTVNLTDRRWKIPNLENQWTSLQIVPFYYLILVIWNTVVNNERAIHYFDVKTQAGMMINNGNRDSPFC